MTALMGLNHQHIRKYLAIELAGESNAVITKEKSTLQFVSPVITVLNGKLAGQILGQNDAADVEDGEESSGASILDYRYTYELCFGTLKTGRYEVIQRIHPALASNAMVSFPAGFDSHSESSLILIVKPLKKIDLSELPWIMGLSVVY